MKKNSGNWKGIISGNLKIKKFFLACGGGTPCFSDNMEWMKPQGKVFYLKANLKLILEQVMNETEQRPLLKKINPSELLFFIQKKLMEREPYYSKADFILNVEDLNEDSLSILLHRKKISKQNLFKFLNLIITCIKGF